MARTKQYVVYTREFTKGNVNSKVGVFIEEAKNAIDKSGNISGGVIKFKNLDLDSKFFLSFVMIIFISYIISNFITCCFS